LDTGASDFCDNQPEMVALDSAEIPIPDELLDSVEALTGVGAQISDTLRLCAGFLVPTSSKDSALVVVKGPNVELFFHKLPEVNRSVLNNGLPIPSAVPFTGLEEGVREDMYKNSGCFSSATGGPLIAAADEAIEADEKGEIRPGDKFFGVVPLLGVVDPDDNPV